MKDKKQKYKPEAVFKDMASEYLGEIAKMDGKEMLEKMYFNLYKEKPHQNWDQDKVNRRILFKMKYGKYIDEAKALEANNKKKFKWSYKIKTIFKKARKQRMILVWYLNVKGEIGLPKLCKLYSGNMIIVGERPHEVDPRAFWSMGKYTCLLVREIDRRPVSNLDLNAISKRGDSTDADTLLIKAALHAVYVEGKPKTKVSPKNIMIIVGIIVVGVIAYVLISGGI